MFEYKRNAKKQLISLILAAMTVILMVTPAGAKTTSVTPDFKTLQAQNPDIYAWLYLPGTNINYPVCQSTNDVYYLTHNTQGGLDANGALYTESAYNGKGFTDPVTVIYGHNMRSGKMFGHLEETFRQGFGGHSEAIVYMPGSTRRYRLYAALPVGSSHLLYGRNYYKKTQYQRLLDDIMNSRSLEAIRDKTVPVTTSDRILILSTCRGGGRINERYIVVGKLIK